MPWSKLSSRSLPAYFHSVNCCRSSESKKGLLLIVLGHSIADHIRNVVSIHIAVDTCDAGRDKLEQFRENFAFRQYNYIIKYIAPYSRSLPETWRWSFWRLTQPTCKRWSARRLPAAKGSNVFSRGGQSQKTETKELNRDYGNKNKVYIFRLTILQSRSFEWQFCEAHCLQWQIANFLIEFYSNFSPSN